MKKDEFISSLERLLRSLKREERNRFLSYYSEMIADYMEDGCEEVEAVQRIGNPGEIAQEILSQRRPAAEAHTQVDEGRCYCIISPGVSTLGKFGPGGYLLCAFSRDHGIMCLCNYLVYSLFIRCI